MNIRLGYLEDPRLARAIEWLAATIRTDDGASAPPPVWPYDKYEMCPQGTEGIFLEAIRGIPRVSANLKAHGVRK